MRSAVKNCPECGNTVLKATNICIKCGYDFDADKTAKLEGLSLSLLVVSALTVFFSGAHFITGQIFGVSENMAIWGNLNLNPGALISLSGVSSLMWSISWLFVGRSRKFSKFTRIMANLILLVSFISAGLTLYIGLNYRNIFEEFILGPERTELITYMLPVVLNCTVFFFLILLLTALMLQIKSALLVLFGIGTSLALLPYLIIYTAELTRGINRVVNANDIICTIITPAALLLLAITLFVAVFALDKNQQSASDLQ